MHTQPLQNGQFPVGLRIAQIAKQRTEAAAQQAVDSLLAPEHRKTLMANCRDKDWMPMMIHDEGVIPSYMAVLIEDKLRCPVYPIAFLSSGGMGELPGTIRGMILMVPRIDIITAFRVQSKDIWPHLEPAERRIEGFDPVFSLRDDLEGWDFLFEAAAMLRIKSPVAGFVSDLKTGQALQFGDYTPAAKKGIYTNAEREDFLLPVRIDDELDSKSSYFGIYTERSLDLPAKIIGRRPTGAMPEASGTTEADFDRALWHSQLDEYKRGVAKAISEQNNGSIELLYLEATPGSWHNDVPLKNGSQIWAENQAENPHFAIGLEVDCIAEFLATHKPDHQSTGRAVIRLKGYINDDTRHAIEARYHEVCKLMENYGHRITPDFSGLADDQTIILKIEPYRSPIPNTTAPDATDH